MRGMLNLIQSKNKHFSFILNPKTNYYKNSTAKIDINGKLVFGYPRRAAKMRRFNHFGQLYLDADSHLLIDGQVEFLPGNILVLLNGARLKIGDNTYFAGNSIVVFSTTSSIGKNCAISWDVTIIDNDLHDRRNHEGMISNHKKRILIGDNVWIGHRCSILKGAEIGDNSIVCAGSVVNRAFPPNSVIGGIPAKKISENNGTWDIVGHGLEYYVAK